MKLIIDIPDGIVKKGFEGPLTDEERMVIIRAVGNAMQYKEPQGDTISRKVLIDTLKTEFANVPQPDTDADYYVGVKQGLKLAETIIDNASTAELYREETCENKSHCYDYEHWHCIGCNGCKKGGAE